MAPASPPRARMITDVVPRQSAPALAPPSSPSGPERHVQVTEKAETAVHIPVRTPHAVAAAKALEAATTKGTAVKGLAGELTARAALPHVCEQLSTTVGEHVINPHHQGIDILARTTDGRVLIIEVKNHQAFNENRPGASLRRGRNGRPDQMSPEWIESRLERAITRSDGNGRFAALAAEALAAGNAVPVLVSATAGHNLEVFIGSETDDGTWDPAARVALI